MSRIAKNPVPVPSGVQVALAGAKLSVKGQLVIPQVVRDEAGFVESDKLVIYGTKDTVIIKKMMTEAAKKDLESAFKLLDSKNLNLTPGDVEKEIRTRRATKKTSKPGKRRH